MVRLSRQQIAGWAAFSVIAVVVFFTSPRSAYSDHLVYLPLIPNTPLMQRVIAEQEHTWCVDSRAAAYPGFIDQLQDVNSQYFERVGIRHRQVAFSDPACQVKHAMPD